MSTPNFRTQRDFDLWVTVYERPSDEDIAEYEEENECEYDDETESYWFYEDLIDNFKYALKHAEEHFNRSLMFHEIELKDGHYDGVQMYVSLEGEVGRYFDHVEDMDNEDTNYYYDMCRSKTIKKYESEKRFINNKLLPYLASETGMRRLNCVGIFSNGEAIYEWA